MTRITILFTAFLATPAVAYESDWCQTFAIEAVTVMRVTDPDYATADASAIDLLTSRAWAICLNSDEPPTLAALGVSLKGVVPAAEMDRVAACRREYRTFRESDMTVIRRGSGGKRVPCPL